MTLATDPKWKKLQQGVACSCGETHVGMFPMHILVPLGWPGSATYEDDAALRMDGDFLSHNLCVREGKYFCMRMRLPIRIRGGEPNVFMFTVWASLNRPDFEGYLEARRRGELKNTSRARARLINRLNLYPDTFNLMGTAFQQEDGGPPLLIIQGPQPDNDPKHPLITDQREGIDLDRVFDLFATYGHDMRPNLR